MAKFRVVGISFDHIHMGDLLREVFNHPDAEIAGIYDPDRSRMQGAVDNFMIPPDRVFTDLDECMSTAKADLAIICARTGEHADVVEKVAAHKVNVLVEKPFAASVADARRIIASPETEVLRERCISRRGVVGVALPIGRERRAQSIGIGGPQILEARLAAKH